MRDWYENSQRYPEAVIGMCSGPSIRDGTGAVPYGAPCLMTLSSSPPCQQFDPRMRNIGAGWIYGQLSTAGIDDQVHVLQWH